MPSSTNVTNLKINELTEAQYDAAVQGGVIGANELSIITDASDAIQVSSMPTAAAGEEGKIYQFVGTTDANYTNGYFYKCVSDGQNPATYSWTQTDVQPAPSGLPDQTGQSGKFLTTDGTDASWATISALQNTATGTDSLDILNDYLGDYCVHVGTGNPYALSVSPEGVICVGYWAYSAQNYTLSIGYRSSAAANGISDHSIAIGARSATGWAGSPNSRGAIALGAYSHCTGINSIAIGRYTEVTKSGAIQLGSSTDFSGSTYTTNNEANTFKVANANGNYKMMDADGTIPADRLASTTGLADGNYRLRLTMASGVPTLSWVAE